MKISLTKMAVTMSLLLLVVVSAFSAPSRKAKKGISRTAVVANCSQVTSATLATQVNVKLAETASLASQYIEVEVSAGVVTLRGNVRSSSAKNNAARAAASVKCVRRVVNLLKIDDVLFGPIKCCCDGECWYQSGRPCPICSRIKPCIETYKAEVAAASGNKNLLADAWAKLHACICKESQ